MEESNVFIDKEEINKLFKEEKYKNCMDKKYFEYIVSNNKLEYIDKYLKNSKNKRIIESLVLKKKVIKVIDKLSVRVENKRYVGELENSKIYDIEVSKEIVDKYHDQILTNGVFSLIKLEENIDKKYPYYVEEIEVLEDVNVNLDEYKKHFSSRIRNYRRRKGEKYDDISEIDLVLNTIGISTVELMFWEKILFLVRLIPLCEANYNLMELGGNGIGKTNTYGMFSPECEIVQEMLATELIYNRQSNAPGLLNTKDVIVFDEINKLKLEADKEKTIPSLLNFMADGKTTSPRKIASKTSLVFSGNVMGIQERIEKNEKNIFDRPHKLEDSAFLDRIHFFLPAWGLRRYSRTIHGLEISKRIFRFDYFSKALSLLREEDYSVLLDERGYIIKNGSEREITAIRKTVSGLIKLTHPDKRINSDTLEVYLAIAIKGRGLINKFLNNKNKSNIDQLNVNIINENNDKYIKVDQELKNFIYKEHEAKINRLYHKYKLRLSDYLRKNDSETYHYGKFYPNRHINILNNEEKNGQVTFVKIALDKIGIQKNEREYDLYIKNRFTNIWLKNNGTILILEIDNCHIYKPNSYYKDREYKIEYLSNSFELNYDGLFGGDSLDINSFEGLLLNGNSFEIDDSNIYFLNLEKKIKCEICNEEIVPEYFSNPNTKNYYYCCPNHRNRNEGKSQSMNYVEFKYFLRDNGVIKF